MHYICLKFEDYLLQNSTQPTITLNNTTFLQYPFDVIAIDNILDPSKGLITLKFALETEEFASHYQHSGFITTNKINTEYFINKPIELTINPQDTAQNKITLIINNIDHLNDTEIILTAKSKWTQTLETNLLTNISSLCNLTLGSSRCGINLTQSQYTHTASITKITSDFTVEFSPPLSSQNISNFSLGSTILNNAIFNIKDIAINNVSFYKKHNLQIGDTITLRFGCNKSLDCCKTRFKNTINFLGILPISE